MISQTHRISDSIHRRSFVGDSDVRIIEGADEMTPAHLSKKRGLVEPEQLSGHPRQAPRRDRTNARLCTCPIQAAHAEFVAALKGQLPRAISLDVETADLDDRANYLNKMLIALSVYVTAILENTAQNVPGGLDLGGISAGLSDLLSDVTGTIQLAADAIAGRVA